MNTNLRNNTRWRNGRLGLLLPLLVAALLAPIWTVRYIPAGDYPNHLASAFVLAHLDDPRFAFHSFYAADWNSYPYLMMSGVLVLLQKAVSIDLAGRLLLSLCVLAVPASAWWFLRETNPGEEMLALWTLITTQNTYFFLNGFLNMQLGLALCLVVLAAWVRFMKNPRILWWVLLLVAVTALYFTHLMAVAIAGLVLTVHTLIVARRRLLMLWALFIPAAACYLHSEWHRASTWNVSYGTITWKLAGLFVPVLGFSITLDFLTLAACGLCWFWALYRNQDLRWQAPWMVPAISLFGLYWIFPAAYGSGMGADWRLLPFCVVLGLAAVRLGRRLKPLAAVVLLLFSIRAAALERYFLSLQPHLEALVNVTRIIPPSARVLPLFSSEKWPWVEAQVWAFGVIERGWVSPCLFHDPGVQPLVVKAELYNPYVGSGLCGKLNKQVDWERLRSDYDFLWAYNPTPECEQKLRTIATVVASSDGLVLYRVKDNDCRGRCTHLPSIQR